MTTNRAMTAIERCLPLTGRVLLAALFIPSGWGKLMGFLGTVSYIAAKGVPLPALAAALAVAVELGVGLALLLGWRTRAAALILALFTLAAGVLFHAFWSAAPEQQMMQSINFWKNVAIAGGLLFVAVHGAGPFSIDAARRR